MPVEKSYNRKIFLMLGGGVLLVRLGLGKIRLALLDDGDVLVWFDLEEQVAPLHVGALGEGPALEEARDPGTQVHLVHGRNPPDKVRLVLDGLDPGGDGDHRWGRGGCWSWRGLPSATGEQGQGGGEAQGQRRAGAALAGGTGAGA